MRCRDNETRGAQSATFSQLPNSPTYSLDRFVVGQPRSRPPPGLGHTTTEAGAVAAAEARASAFIREFDTRFTEANRPPNQ
ncbi:hypothetical protein HDV57DRAFT_134163 [Trichoderma longibrachiatum]|uniref:Uncharacterized protein n=1 Tax=Trichoderma longibrachiatum ATCC 18648 TaxID=983965 RepID=A0A2T4BVF2_TRILO|nr:hypothetical protein M440DRAFT_1405018 [Trichoderma longibrachiatum ATCC 18648]